MVENIIGDTLVPRDKSDYQRATDTDCPECKQEKLYVLSIIDNSATIECPRCRYLQHLPAEMVGAAVDLHGRPVKPPA